VVSARLVASPGGRTTVSFRTPNGETGPYAYLGFAVSSAGPIVVSVRPDGALAGVRVFVDEVELGPIAGFPGDFAVPPPPASTVRSGSVVIRLEKGGADTVPLTGRTRTWTPCAESSSAACGQPVDVHPSWLAYHVGSPEGLADVTVPAVMRKDGIHGPIRTDLSLTNRSDSSLQALLQVVSASGGVSNTVPVLVPAHQRVRVEDVVSSIYSGQGSVSDEGALLVRGFAPSCAGDLTVETYYDGGPGGRVGTALPVFVEGEWRSTGVLAAGPVDGDPRLTIYNALAGSLDPDAVDLTSFGLRLVAPDGSTEVLFPIYSSRHYVSVRLSELGLPSFPPGSYFTVESDNPALRVLIVSSDPVSGSPSVIAGPLAVDTTP
jgi:hypothetical protein